MPEDDIITTDAVEFFVILNAVCNVYWGFPCMPLGNGGGFYIFAEA